MTPTSTVRPDGVSAGDELVATKSLLLRERDDDAAQDTFAVLAAGVERDSCADSGLTARLVDVTVQAHQRLVGGDGFSDGGAADAGDDRRAPLDHRPEVGVQLHCLVDR